MSHWSDYLSLEERAIGHQNRRAGRLTSGELRQSISDTLDVLWAVSPEFRKSVQDAYVNKQKTGAGPVPVFANLKGTSYFTDKKDFAKSGAPPFYISISAPDAKYVGKDGELHPFTLARTIVHEVKHAGDPHSNNNLIAQQEKAEKAFIKSYRIDAPDMSYEERVRLGAKLERAINGASLQLRTIQRGSFLRMSPPGFPFEDPASRPGEEFPGHNQDTHYTYKDQLLADPKFRAGVKRLMERYTPTKEGEYEIRGFTKEFFKAEVLPAAFKAIGLTDPKTGARNYEERTTDYTNQIMERYFGEPQRGSYIHPLNTSVRHIAGNMIMPELKPEFRHLLPSGKDKGLEGVTITPDAKQAVRDANITPLDQRVDDTTEAKERPAELDKKHGVQR